MRQNEKDMDLRAKIKAMETAEEEDFGSSSISIIRLDCLELKKYHLPYVEVGFGTPWNTPGPAIWLSSWPSSLCQ